MHEVDVNRVSHLAVVEIETETNNLKYYDDFK